mgnify:CR=1 FL=1
MFVTIIEIDVEPGIDLTKYVGVSGRVRATDSKGKRVVLRFVRGPEHDFDDFTLTAEDGWHDVFFNDAATAEIKRLLTEQLWRIEEDAGIAAEDGWNRVWKDAKDKAERRASR